MKIKRLQGYDLQIQQGADYSKSFQWKYTDTGATRDLTGYTATCQIREKSTSSTVAIPVTVTITDAINGVFKLSIGYSLTAPLVITGSSWGDKSQYSYDLLMVDTNGVRYRVLQGYAFVSPATTK